MKNKNNRPICVFFLSLLVLSLSMAACSSGERQTNTSPIPTTSEIPSTQTPAPGKAALKGVSLSPRSFQPGDFTDFFEKATQVGGIISWVGDWNELVEDKGGGAGITAKLVDQYSYIPLIEVTYFSNGVLLRPLDAATKLSYKDNAVSFVSKYKIKYFGIGVEVNVLFEKSPQDYRDLVGLFNEVYDAIKAVSPDTRVFTVFQLEKMKGLNGGMFGGSNDPANAEWKLMNDFSRSDILAFTTYPGLIYKTPADIPEDYFQEISGYTRKPVAFTETGWHTESSPAGWESSEAEQSEYVSRLFALTREINPEIIIWSFLYDQDTIEPFRSMGLLRTDSAAGKAWNEWIKQ